MTIPDLIGVLHHVVKTSELIGMPALTPIKLLNTNNNKKVSFILGPFIRGLFLWSINNDMDQSNSIPTSDEQPEYDLVPLPPEEPVNPSKTGNKPKRLKAVEAYGYEIGRGLRKKVVTPEDVYKLAAIGCNNNEIARWFDIDENTLTYNFSDILAKGREDVKMALRQAQLKLALGGNAVMQIWLGKNLLGQSDNPVGSEANAPLPWSDDE